MRRLISPLAFLLTFCWSLAWSHHARGQELATGSQEDVRICGVVHRKSFWGPPNFREEKANDSKWTAWILGLNSPIQIATGSELQREGEATVNEIQLESLSDVQKKALGRFNKKRVVVSGRLWTASSQGDITPVIMTVTNVDASSPGCP